MQGVPLGETVASDTAVREAVLYGIHGGHVNVNDGRHVYMRGAANKDNLPLYNYTLMPTHMRHRFKVEELQEIELREPFSFTKDCPTMRIGTQRSPWAIPVFETMLYDTESDPGQLSPIEDAAVEGRMTEKLLELMRANDAPPEQFERLGI